MALDPVELAEVRQLSTSGEAREIRLSSKLSFAEIADACGVDQSTVARWETGQRLPRGPAAIRYLAILKALRAAHATGGGQR